MSHTKLPEALYDEHVRGYEILYASITENRSLQICLKEEVGPEGFGMNSLEDYPYKIISYLPDVIPYNNGFHVSTWSGISYLYSLIVPSENKGITLTEVFRVSERGSDIIDICKPREEWDDFTRAGKAIRIIGEHVYAAGVIFKLFRRTGVGEWEDLTIPEEHPALFEKIKAVKERYGRFQHGDIGFDAFDGFDEQSIYAGGDQAFWKYDGQQWSEIILPDDLRSIDAILCAGDGYVYVAGKYCPILRGRDDQWEVLDTPNNDYQSLAWFDGKVWVSSGSGSELGFIEDGRYQRYRFPKEPFIVEHFLGIDACEDRLLVYGPHQVILFDGKEWEAII